VAKWQSGKVAKNKKCKDEKKYLFIFFIFFFSYLFDEAVPEIVAKIFFLLSSFIFLIEKKCGSTHDSIYILNI
jgi:hypothetical protein